MPIWKANRGTMLTNIIPHKTVLTIILTLFIGVILTHGVDDYINNHDFLYQSPIVITSKMVSPVIVTKIIEVPIATQEAQPVTPLKR